MLWEEKHIRKILNNLEKQFNLSCESIAIRISNRMISTLGCYSFKIKDKNLLSKEFVFSKSLLEYYSDEDIINVIKHEYLHFYVNTLYNKNMGHNKIFKEYCNIIGIDDKASSKIEPIKKIPHTTNYKYKITCKKCGNVFYRKRIYRGINYFSKHYRCSKCMGKFVINSFESS